MRVAVYCVVALFIFGQATAAPLSYSEESSGDLHSFVTLDFDGGVNIVSGTESSANSTALSDFDSFSFVIPDGYELTKATFSVGGFEQSSAGQVNYFTLSMTISKDGLNQGSGGNAVLFSGGAKIADQVLVTIFEGAPLGAGIYKLLPGMGRSAETALILSADYTLSFYVEKSVSEVPVPAALLFMLTGLFGLGAFGRKRLSV